MGYSLYITRRDDWSDPEGPVIALSEWVSLVEADPELRWEPELGQNYALWDQSPSSDAQWLSWENGNIESKHPEQAMIRKMYEISESLSARLMGEDGEGYDRNGVENGGSTAPARSISLSLWQRVRAIFGSSSATDPGLPVGSRVRDVLGRAGTVASIDLRAANGLGSIVVRYDNGSTESFAVLAHGLERIEPTASGV